MEDPFLSTFCDIFVIDVCVFVGDVLVMLYIMYCSLVEYIVQSPKCT